MKNQANIYTIMITNTQSLKLNLRIKLRSLQIKTDLQNEPKNPSFSCLQKILYIMLKIYAYLINKCLILKGEKYKQIIMFKTQVYERGTANIAENKTIAQKQNILT